MATCVSVNASTGHQFIDDASLGGKVRTVYYDIEDTYDKKQGAEKYRTGAWTGALHLDLQSGYAGDIFAVGGSFYGVTKIKMDEDKYKHSYQLLKQKNNGKYDGFSKLGQAWADFKFGQDEDVFSGHFKAGRQLLYEGLISSSGSRSVPSTWQGYHLETMINDTRFGLGYVNKMSLRDQDDFYDLKSFEDKKIDYIVGADISHTFALEGQQNLMLRYRNAYAKDFLKAHSGEVSWTMPVAEECQLTLGAIVFYTKENGKLWSGKAWGAQVFDKDATVGNLNAAYEVSGWTFEAAVSKFKAEAKVAAPDSGYAEPPEYYYDFGKNTHGIWNIPTSGYAEDMMYDGETVWKLGAFYDFTRLGAEGLILGYSYHCGSGMKVTDSRGNKKKVSEDEHDIYVKYLFPQEMLRGLKFKLKYGKYRNDKELAQAIRKEENDLRVWLDYSFTIF